MSNPQNQAHKPLYDRPAVLETWRLIVGDGNVTELRALDAVTSAKGWPRTHSGYFDNAADFADAVATIRSARGIYFIPNPVDPALIARAANRIKPADKGSTTQDTNITARRWLLIDTDPQRPAHISATDAEHEAALQRARDIAADLQAHGWPLPILADSSNGAHVLFRIDLPADDGGLVQRCLQALAARFDDDAVKVDQSVFNPARIWKCYGCLSCKGDDVAERPWRMSRTLQAPEEMHTVPVELLQALANEAPTPAPVDRHATRHGEPFDVAAFIRRHGLETDGPESWNGQQGPGRRWVFRQSPLCDHHDGAAFILQHASGAITAGCHHNSCAWTWQALRAKYEPIPTRPERRPDARTAGLVIDGAKPEAARLAARVEPYWPFPVDALPGPLDDFVTVAATAMVCDPSFVGLPLLAALAAAIGSTRRVVLKRGWSEPAIVWVAIVGESGTTKTPAFKLVMKPIRELQRKTLVVYADETGQYETALARYEKDLGRWKRDRGDSDPPEKPEQPQAVRYIVSDTTVEALAPLLLANPRGLLLARDELAGWLGSFDRYAGGKGGSDSAHWLSAHNGESVIIDRKTGPTKTIYVPQAYVSVCGGIQPAILHRALGIEHRESGLAARLLLTCPPRRPKRWTDADIAPDVEATFARLLARLYGMQPTTGDDGQPAPVYVGMMPDAKRLWVDFYDAHGQEQVDLAGELSAAWSKLEGYAARLALIIHYARWAADDSSLRQPDRIDADSMARAIALAEWFKREARRVYGVLSESDEQRERRQLVEWIARKGGAVTIRDLQRGPRQYRIGHAAEAALQELAKAGLGYWQDSPTTTDGGRPTRVFRLRDSGDGDETSSVLTKTEVVSPSPVSPVSETRIVSPGRRVKVTI